MLKRAFRVGIVVIGLMSFISTVSAQANRVECGDIIEGEFEERGEDIDYEISLSPGDQVTAQVDTVGDALDVIVDILSPGGFYTGQRGYSTSNAADSGQISQRGSYTINLYAETSGGIFTLYVGCVLRDGTVINPGDTLSAGGNSAPAAPAFSGNGFPGLAPVDFSGVARIPMIAEVPMTGAVTPSGSEILGYTMRAEAGDVVDLSFTRLSGNLNLGLVVLSAQNQVVFQASLVTSDSLTTRFTVPANGQYTVGVFRMDLLPPASPEATAFQVMATINP